MNRFHLRNARCSSTLALISTLVALTLAAQETVKVEGLIKGRSGDLVILQTRDNPDLVVELTEGTDVGQVQGALKARNKKMSMAALIPGLAIKVEGNYHDGQLVAQKVRFKGNDLKQAEAIEAEMHETKLQTQQNQEELEKHKAELEAQKHALQQQEAKVAANKAAIAANKAGVDATDPLYRQLYDYENLEEITASV